MQVNGLRVRADLVFWFVKCKAYGEGRGLKGQGLRVDLVMLFE